MTAHRMFLLVAFVIASAALTIGAGFLLRRGISAQAGIIVLLAAAAGLQILSRRVWR